MGSQIELVYTDEWSEYHGDYGKLEYDIELYDGRIICNVYPNAGKFCELSEDKRQFAEEDVKSIRLSFKPITWLNDEVSPRYKEWNESPEGIAANEGRRIAYESREHVEQLKRLEAIKYDAFEAVGKGPDPKIRKGIPFRRVLYDLAYKQKKKETPRRNEPCTCGSKLKYKKCCINKENQ